MRTFLNPQPHRLDHLLDDHHVAMAKGIATTWNVYVVPQGHGYPIATAEAPPFYVVVDQDGRLWAETSEDAWHYLNAVHILSVAESQDSAASQLYAVLATLAYWSAAEVGKG